MFTRKPNNDWYIGPEKQKWKERITSRILRVIDKKKDNTDIRIKLKGKQTNKTIQA